MIENGKTIAELGLRFRPANHADMAAHAEMLRLLTEDLSAVEPRHLQAAARRWVTNKAFMPKASELLNLAAEQEQSDRLADQATGQSPAERANARLAAEGKPAMWSTINGEAIVMDRAERTNPPPLTRDELESMASASPTSPLGEMFTLGIKSGFLVRTRDGSYAEATSERSLAA